MSLETETLNADANGVARAARYLNNGALLALPTETVYGLGADARNARAVARIFEAKGRPHFNPLIVHVPDAAAARELVAWPEAADRLAAAFWPGPLSLVLPIRPESGVAHLVTGGLQTLAVRVPAHPVAQDVLRAFGGPVAAPSANPSGKLSPTTAAHVLSGLSGKIAAVLDAGACPIGLESTIVALTPVPRLLRPGGLPADALEAALGLPLGGAGSGIEAPGQLASHYAPRAVLRLQVTDPRPEETVLGFGRVDSDLNLSPSGDLVEAAANLFGHLHRLDASETTAIAVTPIPESGLGRAINDRLRRAAAPRA
ncbi:MAG: L-threonylcarbamoyladenylate synthase [Pseudomonadota bacterium]